MQKIKISKFDVVDHLDDEDMMAGYLSCSIEEGGIPLLLKALGDVARARGMTGVAEAAGLTRASLYKSLDESANPSLKSIFQVIDTLGFRISIEPKAAPKARSASKAPPTATHAYRRTPPATPGHAVHEPRTAQYAARKKPAKRKPSA